MVKPRPVLEKSFKSVAWIAVLSWPDRDVRSPPGEDRASRTAVLGVDAFTDGPFGGNPAMVCLLPKPADDEWMQRAAAELNQPATAFLHDRRLRWFTPSVELPLCGHATLPPRMSSMRPA
jgi:hypothetical protein